MGEDGVTGISFAQGGPIKDKRNSVTRRKSLIYKVITLEDNGIAQENVHRKLLNGRNAKDEAARAAHVVIVGIAQIVDQFHLIEKGGIVAVIVEAATVNVALVGDQILHTPPGEGVERLLMHRGDSIHKEHLARRKAAIARIEFDVVILDGEARPRGDIGDEPAGSQSAGVREAKTSTQPPILDEPRDDENSSRNKG